MTDQTPLDAPEYPIAPRRNLTQKIFIGIELLLWAIVLTGIFLKAESWPRGSEVLILSISTLGLFYFLAPIPLLGSRGLGQHLGAHAVGFALMINLWGRLFILESWEYGREMAIISLPPVAVLLLTTTIIWLARRRRPDGGRFYRNAAIRLGILLAPTLISLV